MGGEKILVVEDNEVNLELIREILLFRGYTVLTATDGQAAVEEAKRSMPALILMDIQLPVIDGYQTVKLLRQDPRFKDVLIIAITSYAMKGDREKVFACGCDGYIAKPIDTRSLPEVVAKFLRRDSNGE